LNGPLLAGRVRDTLLGEARFRGAGEFLVCGLRNTGWLGESERRGANGASAMAARIVDLVMNCVLLQKQPISCGRANPDPTKACIQPRRAPDIRQDARPERFCGPVELEIRVGLSIGRILKRAGARFA